MKPILYYILPEDIPPKDRYFIDHVSSINRIAAPLAFALSYSRNQSLKWALIHAFIGAPYLAYRSAEVIAEKADK